MRLTTTGAAAKAFVVKTAAETALARHSGATVKTPMSGRPLSFSPATAAPARNPAGEGGPRRRPAGFHQRDTPRKSQEPRVLVARPPPGAPAPRSKHSLPPVVHTFLRRPASSA